MSTKLDVPLKSKIGKMRIMEKVQTPSFKSQDMPQKFMRGNQECMCVCKTKYLPRNALLIRPHDINKADPIYELMNKAWLLGRMKWLGQGTCQQAINVSNMKKEFHYVLKYASISCIDNVDNSTLIPGDILLTRHGEKLIGKPHLILERK